MMVVGLAGTALRHHSGFPRSTPGNCDERLGVAWPVQVLLLIERRRARRL